MSIDLDEDDINLVEQALMALESATYLNVDKGRQLAIQQRLNQVYAKLRPNE